MKTIKEKEIFPVNAQAIWDIISDPTNSSWVPTVEEISLDGDVRSFSMEGMGQLKDCLLYTSPSPRDRSLSRMPSSA